MAGGSDRGDPRFPAHYRHIRYFLGTFLALRTLQQLAEDKASRFPLGATAITCHSYVDNILAGGENSG